MQLGGTFVWRRPPLEKPQQKENESHSICEVYFCSAASNLQPWSHIFIKLHVGYVYHLQKQDDPCIGHGIRKTQDSTSHDCIAQVEDWHPKRGFSFKLQPMQDRGEEWTG